MPRTKESGKVSMEAFSMLNERYSNALMTIRELQTERDALREALERLEPKMAAASAGKSGDFVSEWLADVRAALGRPE